MPSLSVHLQKARLLTLWLKLCPPERSIPLAVSFFSAFLPALAGL